MADNGFGKLSMQVDDRDIDIGQDDALRSVETTMRFLALCDRYGSPEAVAAATRIRRTLSGAPGGGRGCAYGSGSGATVWR